MRPVNDGFAFWIARNARLLIKQNVQKASIKKANHNSALFSVLDFF
ncbi:hypothetical protein SBA6_40062 [Candidatus Sulfopaludibacter sp. SbA6]|nr:hypothetical protein SBA6_40062 [Candidatus Sulfopaludibacter sp. SbA6]